MTLANTFMRFRRMSPLRLVRDIARARRLMLSEPGRRPPAPRPERLVVSLTTVPERMDRLQPVLRSLIDQTVPADRIIVWRPAVSRRSGLAYPDPGPLPDGVEVLASTDEGPATKLLPALVAEPGAAVVVVDDDVIYPVDFLEQLLAGHRAHPKAAIGWRGWRIVDGVHAKRFPHIFATGVAAPTPVDILLGTWGYLVPPGAFDASVHAFDGHPPAVRFVDDVWFSGHLAKRGIARLVIPAKGLPIETRASSLAALTDGPNKSGGNDRTAIEIFAKWW
ncbi:hypothetical protein [Phreatobacter stygius]|uniref:Glycosyltransferase family 2 protein n=1 Tax=Phreatobacter stygius TaxID=1940610 RepID=A0A4D7AXT8_9HYPH|nr:hypothetical protein [Phreatobacter stygius]QCI66059.1 hypothetical protein E8M01_18695 [Phreatobacter stygius]